ncbi:MAG: class I SAM-dependent methyltransferase [Candidatus Omnitrophica bacterium]|nr:class I SAM-dependent methyltransferase [Candidatus Omnitrophota bacterium]
MSHNFNYISYLLTKPFHSYKHKVLKKRARNVAFKSNLYQNVLKELSEYTNQDASLIENKRKELTSQINRTNYDILSEEELERFYGQNTHSLYNLPLWNAECGRSLYFSWLLVPYLKRHNFKTILDFGAGSGDLCIELANRDFSLYYTDINRILVDFADWRFKKRSLNIKIIEPEDLDKQKVDCLVSFDVFEHLKDLPLKLKKINSFIKKGGGLIFNIEFDGGGLHLEENQAYSDENRLDRVLSGAGFIFDWKFKKFFFYRKVKDVSSGSGGLLENPEEAAHIEDRLRELGYLG